MAIALYPGAFKPPHKGHFSVVKTLLDNTFSAAEYDLTNYSEKASSLLKNKGEKVERIEKVIVFIGNQVRNGIDQDISTQIWNLYKKHLPEGKVEIHSEGIVDPLKAAKEYARNSKDATLYTVTGIRGEEDIPDLRRVGAFKNVPNVKGLAFKPNSEDSFRGTNFRQALLSGNLDEALDFFPKGLTKEELTFIISKLKSAIVAETLKENLGNYISEWFNEPKPEFNYAEYMSSILETMLDKGMKILPLPEIKLNTDPDDTFFRPTACYDPNIKEILLYVEGRHPKDVMRSFCHEMIHHCQNIEGRLVNVHTSNINEDENLQKLEEEAYLKGNMVFREWEDCTKKKQVNETPDKTIKDGSYLTTWEDQDAYPFGYYKGKIQIGDYSGDAHSDIFVPSAGAGNSRSSFKYAGRMWTDRKILSFWYYPETKRKLDKLIYDLNNTGKVHIDDSWEIEIESKDENNSKFIPIEDYRGSKDPKEVEHVKSPLLKKPVKVPPGVGSRKGPDLAAKINYYKNTGIAEELKKKVKKK